MRFNRDEDFSIIINAMRELGLPIKPHMPQIPVLPSPAPSTVMSFSSALPSDTIPNAHSRPTSASSNSSQARVSSRAILPPYAEFKVPARPDTAESLRQRPGSAQSGALESFASSIPLPVPSHSRKTSLHEPSKSLYMSQLNREVRRPSLQNVSPRLCN